MDLMCYGEDVCYVKVQIGRVEVYFHFKSIENSCILFCSMFAFE